MYSKYILVYLFFTMVISDCFKDSLNRFVPKKPKHHDRRITWPFDGDAGLVFRSAHFATYFTILSVKLKPLCIGPIMSAKADKGDRKREIEQSPMKKKFWDSAISSEDLDDAIANRIELAFKEHQSTLNLVVNSAVRDAMDSMLIPALRELREDIQATNKSVKELREEFEAIVTETKQTRDCVDSVQADAREDRRTVTDLRNQLERLTEKMTDMEDRCRRNNVRLVGLPEAAGFLRVNLSKWIPSLRGRDIEIDRAHRVYDGGRGSDRPHTLIFRVLRWHDRSDILKGARQAYSVKCAQSNVTLLFFPDFSPATAIRRKAFGPVLKMMTALGLQPFLIYPAVIKLRHNGEQMSFDSPQKAEDFISSLSQQKTYAAALREGNGKTAATISPARQERLDGREGGGSRCPGRDGDRMDMKAWTCLLLFLLSFLLLGYSPYLSGTTIYLLVRLTPLFFFFFLDGTNGE